MQTNLTEQQLIDEMKEAKAKASLAVDKLYAFRNREAIKRRLSEASNRVTKYQRLLHKAEQDVDMHVNALGLCDILLYNNKWHEADNAVIAEEVEQD